MTKKAPTTVRFPDHWDETTPVLLAIDATNLLHRSYHALRQTGMTRRDGSPVWALHGIAVTISRFAEALSPHAIVSALDSPGGCPARKAAAPEYKQGRSVPDPELRQQLEAAPALLGQAGLGATTVNGWEADDILSSAVRAARRLGWNSVVVTSDRDAYQLIAEDTVVMKPDGKTYDEATLLAEVGVNAAQYLQLAALRGEESDNLTGVPGIGAKTAAKLLNEFGTVQDAVQDPVKLAAVIGKAATAKLQDHIATYERNVSIATLRTDLPVDAALTARPDPDRAAAAFVEYELPQAGAKLATALRSRRR